MTSIATLFAGFDGVSVGAKAAGLELAWGIELDPQLAEVANANLGKHVVEANVLDCDPRRFEPVDVLHASPPCPNFSQAKTGGIETPLDIALGEKVAEFVSVLQPPIFTLENVWAYRTSRSWHVIEEALHRLGYWVSVEHVNSADYAVPQTRKRMIVRAVRGGFVPYLPAPVAWVGWYAAVADLIDSLPESQFARWQLARLPQLLSSVLVPQGGDEHYNLGAKETHEPSMTITANHNQLGIKAFLVSNAKTEYGDGLRFDDEPAGTVTGESNGRLREFLMAGGGNTNFEEAYPGRGCRYADEPAHTVTATSKEGGAMPRAWIIDGANASPTGQLSIRCDGDPAMTVTTGGARHPLRSLFDNGRVVAMTPRALARFQSFPDTYRLPDNARLAAKGIGNAVPPLMYQRIIESLKEVD